MGDYVLDGRGNPLEGTLPKQWWMFLLLGLASIVVGMILVLDLVVAVETLVWFVALGLMFTGLGELLGAGRYRTALSMAAGAFLLVAGVVALVWPGITLWALAVVAGVGLLLSGGARIAAAVMDKPQGWGWLLAGGVLSVMAGVLALAWPGATVLVLAILLGVRMILFGAVETAFALTLRDMR